MPEVRSRPQQPPRSEPPIDQLAYEQASQALEQQAGVLNELRQRTSTLVAVTALVATFLGGQALDAPAARQGPSGVLMLSLGSLLAGLAFCIGTLLPTRTRTRSADVTSPPRAEDVVALAFSMNVEELIDRAEERGDVEMSLRLDVARTLQLAWNENFVIIAGKQRLFVWASLALLVQSTSWIIYLALGKGVI